MRQYLRATVAFLLPLIVVVSQPVIGQQTRVADPQEARTVALDAELPSGLLATASPISSEPISDPKTVPSCAWSLTLVRSLRMTPS